MIGDLRIKLQAFRNWATHPVPNEREMAVGQPHRVGVRLRSRGWAILAESFQIPGHEFMPMSENGPLEVSANQAPVPAFAFPFQGKITLASHFPLGRC